MEQKQLHEIAGKLADAEANKRPIPSLSSTYPDLTLKDAYQIQWFNAARTLASGRRLVGYKIGLTSREAQKHFQVFEPDYGHLFDSMCLNEGTQFDLTQLIQAKIEGEIAFVLGRDLQGPGVTIADVIRAVDFVTASLEIIDSRIENWKISSKDTIADNGSSARFVLSSKRCSLGNLDLASLGMALSCNGEVRMTGAGGAVLGNPLLSIVFLANELGKSGKALVVGETILSGALSGMLNMRPGESYRCEIAQLGDVGIRVKGGAA